MSAHAGGGRKVGTILTLWLGVQLVAVLGWFVATGITLDVVAAMAPLLATGHLFLGGLLWFMFAGEQGDTDSAAASHGPHGP